jgi:hypothetical protein
MTRGYLKPLSQHLRILELFLISLTIEYPEKELNANIAKYHEPTAGIRRYVIEYGILERDVESVYWSHKAD